MQDECGPNRMKVKEKVNTVCVLIITYRKEEAFGAKDDIVVNVKLLTTYFVIM